MHSPTRTLYSPKIADHLIPQLYRLARARGIPMTRLVDQLLTQALATEYDCQEALGLLVAETQTSSSRREHGECPPALSKNPEPQCQY